ncbi:ATP-binding protein [Achromobacter aegrifaciens]
MIAQVGDWIDQQQPGGYIYGASRFGKTKCIQWHLKNVLEERFKSVLPLVVWNRRADSARTEAALWHQLLLASRFEFVDPNKPPKKVIAFNQCTQRFISIAESAKKNHIVLLIDEAQEMTFNEWRWLVGLQNELDYRGYLLSIFSVGSHQLSYQHEYLASTGNAHIAARFMAAHCRFHGIRSVDEVHYVLNGYDCESEWPAGSGVSFLEHFAPGCALRGNRLAESSEIFWAAMVELLPSNYRKRSYEFPMQHLARTTEAVLLQLAQGEDWNKTVAFKNLLTELTKTNFPDHMRIIATET